MKKFLKTIPALFIILVTLSCSSSQKEVNSQQKTEAVIFRFSDSEALRTYEGLQLDASHPNLMNPQISDTDYDTVIHEWTQLHQALGQQLASEDFNWGVTDSTVKIVHKIYFNPEGKITHYFFRVLHPTMADSTKVQLAKVIQAFANNYSIGINRNERFAQCGKSAITL